MKSKLYIVVVTFICFIFLTGCWDEKLLKDTRFILSIGLDKDKKGKIEGTYTTPNSNNFPQSTIVTTVEGTDIRSLTQNVNNKVAETLDSTKLKMIFFEDKLAQKDGIYPFLDIALRDPNNPMNSFIVVTKGKAKSYFTDPIPNEGLPSQYYEDLFRSAIKRNIIPEVYLLQASRIFKNKGKDIVVPYVSKSSDKTPKIAGVALFNEGKFTGETLSVHESILFNIMNEETNVVHPEFIEKIFNDNQPTIEDYITINFTKVKHKIKTSIVNGKITAKLTMDVRVEIVESPKVKVKSNVHKIQSLLEEKLTKQGNAVIKKLQKANCDGLAFGRQFMAFHSREFKKIDWEKEGYKNGDISVDFNVKVTQHGLIY
ncbi:Ger(x)C family spore germination protein [Bacillus massiliigorillae]|uniref:Ger(x)C family spore germination protein n=1 Tax=Bacillus massiliigorillae TaxID=1243664 RepID=UPI0003A47AE5|nr:Ger(x)C family spore germination protein [Bacillus massiliigorillae]